MALLTIPIGTLVFNSVDLIIVIIAVLAAIVGAIRGFTAEFTARAGAVIGILIGLLYAQIGARLVSDTFGWPPLWSTLLSFIVVFIIGYILVMIVGSLLSKTLKAVKLLWLDHTLGLFLGIAEAFIVMYLLVYLLQLQKIIDLNTFFEESLIYQKIITPLIEGALNYITRKT